MSLKLNVLATSASQVYVALAGILTLPLYLKYMGAEAYGLVGFFAMLQVWFNLLDLGLSPTVARETARFKGGAIDAQTYCNLLRSLQVIFVAIALIGACVLYLGAGYIAAHWLKARSLPVREIEIAVKLMAGGAALRWVSGLYRGCISGAEELVWLGGYNSLLASARFLGVMPVLVWVDAGPITFFVYQLVVAVVELAGLGYKIRRLLPGRPRDTQRHWSFAGFFRPVAPVLKFSMNIAFTSSVWVLVTQTDKLLLSRLLPLSDYGYFTLAVLVANGIMLITNPISMALLPRLTRLHVQNDEQGLIRLYRHATQAVSIMAFPLCLVLAFFAEPILWIWTGNVIAAAKAAPVLRLYALGNGILAIAAFPYYLQYAKGDLKLHLIGNVLFVFLLLPGLVWATIHYGMLGAGSVWVSANLIYFIFWIPLIHRRFARGVHLTWLIHDTGGIFCMSLLAVSGVHAWIHWPGSRVQAFMLVALIGGGLVFLAVLASSWARTCLLDKMSHLAAARSRTW